jgi:dinuclear metal center YbgI/SA1388 family protein
MALVQPIAFPSLIIIYQQMTGMIESVIVGKFFFNRMLKKINAAMEKICPRVLSEVWDNTGLLIEAPYPRQQATRVFLTIDLTSEVLQEAILDQKVGIIISYHPPLFSKFKTLVMHDEKQKIALQCAASGISVYSPHTALDSCVGGINDWLCQGFGTGVTTAITQNKSFPEGQEGSGSGRIHVLQNECALDEIVLQIKKHLGLKHVRLAKPMNFHKIKTIAVCAGSGSGVLGGVKADLYLTGEMGHHDVLAAVASGTCVILCEHTNTERGYLKNVLMEKLLAEKFEVICSQLDKDPLSIV